MRTQRAIAKSFAVLPALLAGLGLMVTAATPARADQNELTDTSITEAIEDEFLFDRGVPFNKLDIRTIDGVVTLSGTVNNLMAKKRATDLARTVKGVRSVINKVTVKPSTDKSAATLQSDVNAALLGDPATDSYEIRVKATQDGTVTLRGNVDSWQERTLAEKVAASVSGVTEVVNNVEVDYERDRSDAEIKAEIKQTLRWDTLVDDALINVKVDDGKVMLTGTVGSAAEKREAHLDAWVAGVRSVDDSELEVKKWARDPELRKDKYVVKADDEIRDAVKDAMLHDPRVVSFKVTPRVENGIVTLRGTVDNLKAKRAAEQDAQNTVGVISVKNRLKVRPTSAFTDEMIETDIEAALARDPYVESFEVGVNVIDGIAYLHGSVDSFFEKAQADDIASTVNGVTEVRNNLTVYDVDTPIVYEPYVDEWYAPVYDWYGRRPDFTFKTDQEIAQEIHDELWWSPYVDADQVSVKVEDGVATLTGRVDSWNERRAARENAYEGGAVWVKNHLIVQ